MDACVPRGWDPVPVRQFGALYSFVRRHAPEPGYPGFDPDDTVLAAVSLSRLVRPNSVGYEWALRVQHRDDGSERLMPLDPGAGFLGYVDDRRRRSWLDGGEAERLRDLLAAYWRDEDVLPERVKHALWLCEQTSRQQFLDLAWPQVVMGLEALVHVGRSRSGAQFKTRVAALAQEVGVVGLDDAALDEAWEDRSHGVHGSRITFEEDPEAALKFGRLQRTLQLAVRRAIENAEFRSYFESAAAVRTRWPVEGT
jgi:hypothetical protein